MEESKSESRERSEARCSCSLSYLRPTHAIQSSAIDTGGVCTGGAAGRGQSPGRYSPGLAGKGFCVQWRLNLAFLCPAEDACQCGSSLCGPSRLVDGATSPVAHRKGEGEPRDPRGAGTNQLLHARGGIAPAAVAKQAAECLDSARATNPVAGTSSIYTYVQPPPLAVQGGVGSPGFASLIIFWPGHSSGMVPPSRNWSLAVLLPQLSAVQVLEHTGSGAETRQETQARGWQGRAEVSRVAKQQLLFQIQWQEGRFGVCCAFCWSLAGDSPFEQHWAGCAAGAEVVETLLEQVEISSFSARAETNPRGVSAGPCSKAASWSLGALGAGDRAGRGSGLHCGASIKDEAHPIVMGSLQRCGNAARQEISTLKKSKAAWELL